jgi:hypothetical protein
MIINLTLNLVAATSDDRAGSPPPFAADPGSTVDASASICDIKNNVPPIGNNLPLQSSADTAPRVEGVPLRTPAAPTLQPSPANDNPANANPAPPRSDEVSITTPVAQPAPTNDAQPPATPARREPAPDATTVALAETNGTSLGVLGDRHIGLSPTGSLTISEPADRATSTETIARSNKPMLPTAEQSERVQQAVEMYRGAVGGSVNARAHRQWLELCGRVREELDLATALGERSAASPLRDDAIRTLAGHARPIAMKIYDVSALARQQSPLLAYRNRDAAAAQQYDALQQGIDDNKAQVKTAMAHLEQQVLSLVPQMTPQIKLRQTSQPSGFSTDPSAAVQQTRQRLQLAEGERNVAYGEVSDAAGRPLVAGSAVSGPAPMEGTLDKTGRYDGAARGVRAEGQHGGVRKFDSEVKILENAAEAVKANPAQTFTVRIHSEKEPCPSCRRVMAQFLVDHPNAAIEVSYEHAHAH